MHAPRGRDRFTAWSVWSVVNLVAGMVWALPFWGALYVWQSWLRGEWLPETPSHDEVAIFAYSWAIVAIAVPIVFLLSTSRRFATTLKTPNLTVLRVASTAVFCLGIRAVYLGLG